MSEVRSVSSVQWRPLAEYEAMKKKPRFAAFSYAAVTRERSGLAATVRCEYPFGSRVCNGWIPLPEPIP